MDHDSIIEKKQTVKSKLLGRLLAEIKGEISSLKNNLRIKHKKSKILSKKKTITEKTIRKRCGMLPMK